MALLYIRALELIPMFSSVSYNTTNSSEVLRLGLWCYHEHFGVMTRLICKIVVSTLEVYIYIYITSHRNKYV